MGSHSILQGTFSTQRLNPGILHCRQILYHLSHQGNPDEKGTSIFSPLVKQIRGPFNNTSTAVIELMHLPFLPNILSVAAFMGEWKERSPGLFTKLSDLEQVIDT